MNQFKAQKVLYGNKNYEVAYKDKVVWLENIDEENNEALVSVMDTGEKMKVPIDELEGKGFKPMEELEGKGLEFK